MKTPFPIHVSPERAEAIAARLPEGGIKGVRFRESKVPDPDKIRGASKSSYLKMIGGRICLDDVPVYIKLKGEGWSASPIMGKLDFRFEIDGSHYMFIESLDRDIRQLRMLIKGEGQVVSWVQVESLQVPKDHAVLTLLVPIKEPRKFDMT
jgi:hypothetical protein